MYKDLDPWSNEGRAQTKRVKNEITPGTRIKLNKMNNESMPVKANTLGTVTLVDDIGQIHVHWDNGRQLALVPGIDDFIIMPNA